MCIHDPIYILVIMCICNILYSLNDFGTFCARMMVLLRLSVISMFDERPSGIHMKLCIDSYLRIYVHIIECDESHL